MFTHCGGINANEYMLRCTTIIVPARSCIRSTDFMAGKDLSEYSGILFFQSLD